MKTTTRETYTIPGTDIEVELPYKPSFIMEHKEPLIRVAEDKVIVGYLADDSNCENPLTSCDGMGAIYECRRHGDTLRDYEKALGLYDGGPDLDLVAEEAVTQAGLHLILNDPLEKEAALERCLDQYAKEGDESDEDFLRRILDSPSELECVLDDVDRLRLALWREGRNNGTIGDKHAVLLDVYEHSGISYSLSGEGMQCQWDTARGGAVWVPDKYAREEIVRRGPVYQKGKIIQQPLKSKTQYGVRTYASFGFFDDVVHPTFEHWHEAFSYLEQLDNVTYLQPLADAEHDAAREIAKSAAEEYTSWCNGDCYGVVVAIFDRYGEILDEDACWGYIGDDYAYQALQDEFPKED